MTRLIAEGGMGVVYEGWHTVIDRPFALKFVHRYLADSAEWMDRFRLEAGAAGRLMSDHIAAVLDYGTVADGTPYIVMEYLQGQTLGARLEQDGRLPSLEAAEILRQASRGMAVAHRASVVHRDLKPDNLFLSQTDAGTLRVKVLDFGIAKVEGRLASHATQTGQIMGTPAYMSPEQARGEGRIDQRTDVYSLGVVAYEALTGETLFTGATYNAVLFQVLSREVPPLVEYRSTVADGLAAVVARAMNRDPAQRYADCQELADEFERCLAQGLCVRSDASDRPGRPVYAAGEATTGSVVLADVELGSVRRTFPSGLRWSLVAALLAGFVLALFGYLGRPTVEARRRAGEPPAVLPVDHGLGLDASSAGELRAGARPAGAPTEGAPQALTAPSSDTPADNGVGPASALADLAGAQRVTEPLVTGPGAGGSARPTTRAGGSGTVPSANGVVIPDVGSGLPPPVRGGSQATSAVDPAEPAARMGMLSVQSEQGGGLIVDGKPMGSLPRLGIMLPAGRHEVVFVHPSLGRNRVWVELRPGQAATLGASWPPSASAAPDPCAQRWFVNRLGEREIRPECEQLIDPDL